MHQMTDNGHHFLRRFRDYCHSSRRTRDSRLDLVLSHRHPITSIQRSRRGLTMPNYSIVLGFSLLVGILPPATAQQTVVIPDNLFTQAGFVVKYATTAEKAALLRSLPPDKLVTRRKDGKLYYVYADAERCNCAYVGTPEAYSKYQNWANLGGNAPSGTPWSSIQTIDSSPGAAYIPADIGNSMDSILQPDF
jgi:hypothetical protein